MTLTPDKNINMKRITTPFPPSGSWYFVKLSQLMRSPPRTRTTPVRLRRNPFADARRVRIEFSLALVVHAPTKRRGAARRASLPVETPVQIVHTLCPSTHPELHFVARFRDNSVSASSGSPASTYSPVHPALDRTCCTFHADDSASWHAGP